MKSKEHDEHDENVYGFDAEKAEPLDDDAMGYAASLAWARPTTEEHPTNKIMESHGITSGFWTAKPKGGTQ